MRQYPDFVRLFQTSTPLRTVELSMKKESRDLVASAGHLCQGRARQFRFWRKQAYIIKYCCGTLLLSLEKGAKAWFPYDRYDRGMKTEGTWV